ncbi:unnamed protein product [Litomosoides sigmodontis]|uniref:Uncharacterized protein n=1 Tax=Litomosoides sigmodontis TaxID=42156 RepID=A0A3P6TQQ0_LITSI|nr:unnamed protein product [Litomosoides sigmodontis]
MSSNQSDCLTSLVSYVPELNFGLNLPSTTAAKHFGTSTNQKHQTFPLHPEALTSLEIVSARVNCNFKSAPRARTSLQPLRPALKKASLIKPSNKVEENFENTEKSCEDNRISIPKRATETQGKTEKSQLPPARLLQKKKTVAFGRTVNVSQTIEGTSKAHRKLFDSADPNSKKKKLSKMSTDVQSERFADEFEKLKQKVHELQLKVDELTMKDSERNNQILKLTEAMKKMLEGFAQFNNASSTGNEDSKKCEKGIEREMYYRGKENVPPNIAECMTDDDEENHVTRGELFARSRKKIIDCSPEKDLKWKIVKRKYAENKEFKRLVDEAVMKCGGDESLDILASHQNKGDIGRIPSRRHEKRKPVSPVIRSTTRVTKQMTVEQVQHCDKSPVSCAFSYDSKKYLARHGIIPALSDDDNREYNVMHGKRLDPCMQSYYYPGNSVTYYSKNIKYDNMPLKDNSDSDYQQARYHRKETGALRVFDETNYQVDQFDSSDDEDVNNIIEITDGLKIEDDYETGGKICSPYDKRDWRSSARSPFRYQKHDGIYKCTKQRLNKSTWD